MSNPIKNCVLSLLEDPDDQLTWSALADALEESGNNTCREVRQLVTLRHMVRERLPLTYPSNLLKSDSYFGVKTERLALCTTLREMPHLLASNKTVWEYMPAELRSVVAAVELFQLGLLSGAERLAAWHRSGLHWHGNGDILDCIVYTVYSCLAMNRRTDVGIRRITEYRLSQAFPLETFWKFLPELPTSRGRLANSYGVSLYLREAARIWQSFDFKLATGGANPCQEIST